MKDLSVSVALAAYNGEKYIEEQISSILCQLKQHDELVVGYDESTDNTLSLLRKYSKIDSRVKIVHNKNKGVVGNFDTAIRNCKNDLVLISDQDDIWMHNKRDRVVDIAIRTDKDLIIHNGVHINTDGEIISGPFFEIYKIRPGLIRNFLLPRYSGCCMAIKRNALSYILPLPQSVINYDHWIGVICEYRSGIELCNEVLIHHRLHGGNITTSRRNLNIILNERANLLKELFVRLRDE